MKRLFLITNQHNMITIAALMARLFFRMIAVRVLVVGYVRDGHANYRRSLPKGLDICFR